MITVKELLNTVKTTIADTDGVFVRVPATVRLYNGGIRCDMLKGPCACGA